MKNGSLLCCIRRCDKQQHRVFTYQKPVCVYCKISQNIIYFLIWLLLSFFLVARFVRLLKLINILSMLAGKSLLLVHMQTVFHSLSLVLCFRFSKWVFERKKKFEGWKLRIFEGYWGLEASWGTSFKKLRKTQIIQSWCQFFFK